MKKRKQKKYKLVVLSLLFAIILSFMTYSFAIASTIFSASDMKLNNAKIADIQTEISELESDYFSMINEVSIDNAEEYGLQKIASVGYVGLDKNVRVAYNY